MVAGCSLFSCRKHRHSWKAEFVGRVDSCSTCSINKSRQSSQPESANVFLWMHPNSIWKFHLRELRDFSLTSATRHGADEMWAPFHKRAIPHFAINWGIAAFLTILWRCPKLLRSWGLTLLVSERAEFSFSRKLEQLQTNLAWQVDVKEFQKWHAFVVL